MLISVLQLLGTIALLYSDFSQEGNRRRIPEDACRQNNEAEERFRVLKRH